MERNPFSAGRWVCGEQFIGREDLMANLLDRSESCHWVIGKRRIGKTSMLRQIERRVNTSVDDALGLFWDIQGSYDGEGLFDSLYDAIEDNQDLYPENWQDLDFELVEGLSCPQLLKNLSRALMRNGSRLFLLIDETEELMNVGKQDPVLLSKLRRLFQTNRNTHTIMTSSPTLAQLGRDVVIATSPFLHGFTVSYLGNFNEEETSTLLQRGIEDATIREKIYEITDGNPYETQLVARHFFEDQNLETTLLELETSPTLNQTIEVNYNLLTEDERTILKEIHCGPAPFQDFERALTLKLLRMGYLKQDGNGVNTTGSYFQAKWLGVNLLDGANPEPTRAADVGLVLHLERSDTILKQIMDIYKFFLELAQQGKALVKNEGGYDLPHNNGTLVLDSRSLPLCDEVRDGKNWLMAVDGISTFLKQYLKGNKPSWPVFRLHQMVENGARDYTEKDFLDLMMMIAEEAVLD